MTDRLERPVIPRKLVETFFGRWPLLVVLIAGLTAAGWYLTDAPVAYESTARVWVSDLSPAAAGATASDPTASQRQLAVLRDLLATDSFRNDIALAAGLVGADAGDEVRRAAAWQVGSALAVTAAGPSLLEITARTADPASAQKVVQATIDQYTARLKLDSERTAAIVTDSIQKQLTVAQGELASAQALLAAYLKANPLAADRSSPDAEYLRLQGNLDSQVKIGDRLNASLQDAQLAAVSGQNDLLGITVQDPPRLPPAPVPVSLTANAAYPGAGFVLGTIIAVAYLYLSYRADHSIRSSEDLRGLPVPLLGYVPELRSGPRSLRVLLPRRREYARAVATSLARLPEAPGGPR